MEKWRRRQYRAGYLYTPVSALKALGAMEISVGASPGLERLGGLSGGRGWDPPEQERCTSSEK